MNDYPDMHPVRARREELGMTQRQLAVKAGVAPRTVQNVEAGRHRPRIHIRRKLMRALGLPFERHAEVFGDLGPANHTSQK